MPVDDGGLPLPSRTRSSRAPTLLLAAGTLLTGLSLAALLAVFRGSPATYPPSGLAVSRAVERSTVSASSSIRQPHLSLLLETAAFGGASMSCPSPRRERRRVHEDGRADPAHPTSGLHRGRCRGGILADRFRPGRGHPRGTVLSAGLAALSVADPSWGPADHLWGIALVRSGGGSLRRREPGDRDGGRSGIGASTGASTNVARQLGFAIGPAAATTVWAVADYRAGGLAIALGLAPREPCGRRAVLIRAAQAARHTQWHAYRRHQGLPNRGREAPMITDADINVAVTSTTARPDRPRARGSGNRGRGQEPRRGRLRRVKELAPDAVISSKASLSGASTSTRWLASPWRPPTTSRGPTPLPPRHAGALWHDRKPAAAVHRHHGTDLLIGPLPPTRSTAPSRPA